MTQRARLVFGFFWCALGSIAMWPRLWTTSGLWGGWVGAWVLPLLICLWLVRGERHSPLDIKVALAPTQPIQQLAQVMIYVGLSLHWPQMSEQLPLTLAQVAFAFLVDMLWVWSRGESEYRLSLSPTPIVLSINLFLWFRDEWFAFQWLMVVFAVLSRSLFTWERLIDTQGMRRRVNCFNPSALVICLTGLILILTRSTHMTWGEELAVQHGAGDYAYRIIFAAGLLAQLLAPIGWVTLGGVAGYLFLDVIHFKLTGGYRFIDTAIPPAVFLGLTLLITDPRTIPRGRIGQAFYGLMYSAGSIFIFGLLRSMSTPATGGVPAFSPTFLDKALAIPLLNLLVPSIDRICGLSQPAIGARWSGRIAFFGGWSLLFVGFVAPLLEDHPGSRLSFWDTQCENLSRNWKQAHPPQACMTRDHFLRARCAQGEAALCYNLALSPYLSSDQASLFLERACVAGAARACLDLGEKKYEAALSIRTDSTKRAEVRALVFGAEEAWGYVCSDDQLPQMIDSEEEKGAACFHLANLYATPWWGEPEWPKAFAHLERACRLGVSAACQALVQIKP